MPISNKIKMIDNYIYFYHLDKFCVLPSYPDQINDNMSTTFRDNNSLGRSAPVYSYIQSGPRQVNLTLSFHRDMMNDLNKEVSNLKDNVVDFSGDDYVDTLINYLQSMAVPKYSEYSEGSKALNPPIVAIRFGNTFFIKGVVNGGVQCTYKKPILYNKKYAIAEISFSVYETDPYDAETIVNSGSFRGLTKTFKDGIYNSTSTSAASVEPNSSSDVRSSNNNVESIPKKYSSQKKQQINWRDLVVNKKSLVDEVKNVN